MKRVAIPYCPCFADKSIEHTNALMDDKGVSLSIDQANWHEQFPYKPLTSVYLARTDQMLYVKWHVVGVMLKAVYTRDGEAVFNDSCVEFFCKTPGSEYYYNLEFNAIGTARCARRRSREEDVQPFDEEQYRQILRYSSLGRRPFCEIDGQFVWDLCVAIPLPLLGIDSAHLPKMLLGNFYKCADDTQARHYLSWSPVPTKQPDFHQPQYFGELLI